MSIDERSIVAFYAVFMRHRVRHSLSLSIMKSLSRKTRRDYCCQIYSINLSNDVTRGGAYDGVGTSSVSLQDQII